MKEQQPTWLADLVTLIAVPPWGEPLPSSLRSGRQHGREELRLLRCAAALVGDSDWPGLGYACVGQRVVTRAGKTRYAEASAVTSLTPARTTAAGSRSTSKRRRCPRARTTAAVFHQLWRGQWTLANSLHHLRDVTLDEDRCQVRTGQAPQALAAVRNTVIGIVRRAGHPHVAAALRRDAGQPTTALLRLGIAL